MAFLLPFLAPLVEAVASSGAIEALGAALETGASYAAWAAPQIAQGALTEAGAKSVAYMFSLLSTENAQLTTAATQAKAVSDGLSLLEGVVKDWTGWSLHHFGNKDNFGNITVNSKTTPVFDEFQRRVAGLSDFRNKTLTELIKTASKNESPGTVGELHKSMQQWVESFREVAKFLAKPEAQSMVKAGLNSHAGEIESAAKLL